MTERAVAVSVEILRRHGLRHVVVGGQAIAQDAATATRDVDVMVATDDYAGAVRALGGDPALTLAMEGGAVTRFGIRALDGAPLDLIDAGVFSGKKSGREFFDFLFAEASHEADGVRYASAEAVWYTRLMTRRWRAYAEKIVTNILDGIEVDRLARVDAIARRFGTESAIAERLAYVRNELGRSDLFGGDRRE